MLVEELKEIGMLEAIGKARGKSTKERIVTELALSEYGAEVLIEAGVAAGVLEIIEGGCLKLTKVGVLLKSDMLTNVNFNFAS